MSIRSRLKAGADRIHRLFLPRFVVFEGRAFIGRNVGFLCHHGQITIGDGALIYRNCELLAPVHIGKDSSLNRDCYVRAGTTIGSNVSVGPFVRFVTDTHDLGPEPRRAGPPRFDDIAVEDGVWIGASVTIVGGVRIGRGSVIAAGSVVVHDVAENTMVAGVPARLVRAL